MEADVDGGGFVVLPLGSIIYGGILYLRGVEQKKAFNQSNSKEEQANNPLHGVKLIDMLEALVIHYGWEEMGY
jgi:hypothetical protein